VAQVHSEVLPTFGTRVDFLTIYLREAHPQDIWPLGQHVCINNHKNVSDRITAAQDFVSSTKWALPMVVDTFQDSFMNAYLAHPERFYVIVDGILRFKAQPKDAVYPISDLVDWLNEYFTGSH